MLFRSLKDAIRDGMLDLKCFECDGRGEFRYGVCTECHGFGEVSGPSFRAVEGMTLMEIQMWTIKEPEL